MIHWFRGDQQLNIRIQSGISILEGSDGISTNSQLIVTGFTSEVAGLYSCVAVNALGNDSRSFQVNTVGESVRLSLLLIKSVN